MWRKKPSYTIGEKVNWYSHEENSTDVPKAITELPDDPAVLPLSIYPKEIK